MSIVFCDAYYEDEPTLDGVKQEISDIVGLSEIKSQLEDVVEKIVDAERDAVGGYTVIPPKPFHMVFVGNNGTGKSMVARILGKLFYIAGVLSTYTVTEMQGNQKVKDVEGGILLVNIDEEDPMRPDTIDRIISAMDEEETSIVFAGSYQALNRYMKSNNELYKRFSARLQFDDMTCDELACLLLRKANDRDAEDNLISGFELDESCTPDNIAQIISSATPEDLRSVLNAHLLDQMLIEAKKYASRPGEKVISLRDLGIGIQKGAHIYKSLLNL